VTEVDVVVVSYNNRDHLRACVEPLSGAHELSVVVVDSASSDGSLASVDGLEVLTVQLSHNRGFGHACNVGWRSGDAPYVLFLNPDATLEPAAVRRLVEVAEQDPSVGAVAPKILESDGSIDFSMRHFPRLRSTYAQVLFLHRLFPHARWSDELVREPELYARPQSPEWVSGACLLVRRDLLVQLGGFDEGFFLYCEDIDLCRRIWDSGYTIRFEPAAVAHHEGGASAPRASLLPVLADSRIRYARKHRSTTVAALERGGVALGALTHIALARGGMAVRVGWARALARALTPSSS
jgi:GT2 family glycosyltransferase